MEPSRIGLTPRSSRFVLSWCHDSYQTVTPYAGLEFFTSAPSFEVVGATAMPLLKLWKQGTQLPPTVDLHTDPPVSIVRDPGSKLLGV